jgi:PspA-Associated protein
MIVRISGEDQYSLDGENGRLNELDSAVLAAVHASDEQGFHSAYDSLLAFVRDHGTPLPDDALEGSDLILPPPDISLAEAASAFTGEGLIPD